MVAEEQLRPPGASRVREQRKWMFGAFHKAETGGEACPLETKNRVIVRPCWSGCHGAVGAGARRTEWQTREPGRIGACLSTAWPWPCS